LTIALLLLIFDIIAATLLIAFLVLIFMSERKQKLLKKEKENSQKPVTLSGQKTKYTGESSGEISISYETKEISGEPLLEINNSSFEKTDASQKVELLSQEPTNAGETLGERSITYDPNDPIWNYPNAHLSVNNGYFFTFDQVLALGDPGASDGFALSFLMAQKGYQFTFDEILRLKNPANDFRITLAHLCIHKSVQIGYKGYHDNWISSSGKPYEEYKYSVSDHSYEHIFHNPPFTVEQLIQLGNPADKDGDTVAHWMAKTGHIFTEKELMQLGEPRNKKGESIAYIMARKGEKLTDEEMIKLDIHLGAHANREYLDIKNSEMVPGFEYPGWAYDFYFNGRLTYNYCDGGDMFTSIHILNQEAWSIYLDYLKRTYSREIIDMKFIESLGYKYQEIFHVVMGPPSTRYFPDQAVR